MKETLAPKIKKEVRRPLKNRDIAFIKAKAEGLPNYKAAMVATGTRDQNVASVQAVRMLENVSLREKLDEVLEQKGITIEAAVAPVREALDNDQLDMRLKGSDRAIKLLTMYDNPMNQSPTINFNFGSVKQG
jgi:hypothetical protein